MTDIIASKRNGLELSRDEIDYFVKGFGDGTVPDSQAAALLMAICFVGMTVRETSALTMALARSGEMLDLSAVEGVMVDKHSTGGVGDKTTLIVAAIVAACGVKVAKMSGRGMGHTGGTLDKLSSIPNIRTELTTEEFVGVVNTTGLCVTGQSDGLAPVDKKLNALRDLISATDSVELVVASVMSRKIAAGAGNLLLDVKTGSGAFIKALPQAKQLANLMVEIGESVGRHTAALITNMDYPLGNAVGNSLEVIEAVNTLRGIGPQDLTEVCLALSAAMLFLAGKGTYDECADLAQRALYGGRAFEKLVQMVDVQGGDCAVLLDTNKFKKAKCFIGIRSSQTGYISRMDAELIGRASVLLGAVREDKSTEPDSAAGILLNFKYGEHIKTGETLAMLFAEDEACFDDAARLFKAAVDISEEKPAQYDLILGKIGV